MARRRADQLVVERGLAPTRAKAQALILGGSILAEHGRRVEKAGELLHEDTPLELKGGEALRYVSRGGLKLEAALERFGVDVAGRVCLDVGASTGGFTDCLLQRGAARVYAVDVGYGQLAWPLREDPRVVVLERENIRTLGAEAIAEPCSRIVIDVSFISLAIVLPQALRFASEDAVVVALVKPQFEVGKERVGKGGIVRDAEARREALDKVIAVARDAGLGAVQTMESPILGAKGNREWLLAAARGV